MPNGQPHGSGPAPRLPMMTVAERQLWAASKQLPSGILLIYETEMQQMAGNALEVTNRADAAERAARLYREQLKLCRDSSGTLKAKVQELQRIIELGKGV